MLNIDESQDHAGLLLLVGKGQGAMKSGASLSHVSVVTAERAGVYMSLTTWKTSKLAQRLAK